MKASASFKGSPETKRDCQRKLPMSLLREYMCATSEEEASRVLEELVSVHAGHLINRVSTDWLGIARTRRTATKEHVDAEDLFNEVVAQLLGCLHSLKCSPSHCGIRCFCGYTVGVAERVCTASLRRKTPSYTSFSNQVRYSLMQHEEFALWRVPQGGTLCGLHEWMNREEFVGWGDLEVLLEQGGWDSTRSVEAHAPRKHCMAATITDVFSLTKAPLLFNDLVRFLTRALGVEEFVEHLCPDIDSVFERQTASGSHSSNTTDVEHRQLLSFLWSEVRQLPPSQSAALLLNLRDSQGRGLVDLLLLLSIAELPEIAETLRMSPEELDSLWDQLPLSDFQIAERLGITRQQVINLRKSARQRLHRRSVALAASD